MKAKLVRNLLTGAGLSALAVGLGVVIGSLNKEPADEKKENETKDNPLPETVHPDTNNGEWKEGQSDDDDEEGDGDGLNPLAREWIARKNKKNYDQKVPLNEPFKGYDPKAKDAVHWAVGTDGQKFMINNSVSPFKGDKSPFEEKEDMLWNDDINISDLNHQVWVSASTYHTILTKWYPEAQKRMEKKKEKYKKLGYGAGDLGAGPRSNLVPSPADVMDIAVRLSYISSDEVRKALTDVYVFDAFKYTDGDRITLIVNLIKGIAAREFAWQSDKDSLIRYSVSDRPLCAKPTKLNIKYFLTITDFLKDRLHMMNGVIQSPSKSDVIHDKGLTASRLMYIENPSGMRYVEWEHECEIDENRIYHKLPRDYAFSDFAYGEIPSFMDISDKIELIMSISNGYVRRSLTDRFIHWAFIVPVHDYMKFVDERILWEVQHDVKIKPVKLSNTDMFKHGNGASTYKINLKDRSYTEVDNIVNAISAPKMTDEDALGIIKNWADYTTKNKPESSEEVADVFKRAFYEYHPEMLKWGAWCEQAYKHLNAFKIEHPELAKDGVYGDDENWFRGQYPSPADLTPAMRAICSVKGRNKRQTLTDLYCFYAFEYPNAEEREKMAEMIYTIVTRGHNKHVVSEDRQINMNKHFWLSLNRHVVSGTPLCSTGYSAVTLNDQVREWFETRMNPDTANEISDKRLDFINDLENISVDDAFIESMTDAKVLCNSVITHSNEWYGLSNDALKSMPKPIEVMKFMKKNADIKDDKARIRLTTMYIHWAFVTPVVEYRMKINDLTSYQLAREKKFPFPDVEAVQKADAEIKAEKETKEGEETCE